MWYFTWMPGVGFAEAFGIINAMWLESVCEIDSHGIADCNTLSKPAEGKESML